MFNFLFSKASTSTPVSASAELKQVIWEEPEVIEETVVEESIWDEPEETETVSTVTPKSFVDEIFEEANALVEEAEKKQKLADDIAEEVKAKTKALKAEEDAIKQATEFYEQAQDAYDSSVEYLSKKQKQAKDEIVEAVNSRALAESKAKAKIAAMRAARAAGLTYAQYLEQVEQTKLKANAEAIAKAKSESEAKAKAKAEERAKYNAMIPRI
jgi:colicin import membrane protein